MEELEKQNLKKKGRGPGKKPRLFCTSLRLTQEVMAYFRKYHPNDMQAQMRAVLVDYVQYELKQKEPHHGTQETVDE